MKRVALLQSFKDRVAIAVALIGDLPSEESVCEDSRLGWQGLARREPDATNRYIYGHSLGMSAMQRVNRTREVSVLVGSVPDRDQEPEPGSIPAPRTLNGYAGRTKVRHRRYPS